MTLTDLLHEATAALTKVDIAPARLDAEVLLAHAMGMTRADLYARRSRLPSADERRRFDGMLRRRSEGCPVAYLLGVKEFWSIPIAVTPDVLIPRPETELVVERALHILKEEERRSLAGTTDATRPSSFVPHPSSVLDLCTGSGCIAAALATELPAVRFTVTDISPKALEVARTNLAFAGDRAAFCCGDLFEALPKDDLLATPRRFDLITANPPYIPADHKERLGREITAFEPPQALFAGKSGLDFAARIIEDAPRFLKPGGWLVMEVGQGQSEQLSAMAQRQGSTAEVAIAKDLAGIERVLCMRTSPLP